MEKISKFPYNPIEIAKNKNVWSRLGISEKKELIKEVKRKMIGDALDQFVEGSLSLDETIDHLFEISEQPNLQD